ncbi:MAG: hypothetical protein AB1330_12870 [Bacillota bacterium]
MTVRGIIAEFDHETVTLLTPEGDLYNLSVKDCPAEPVLGRVVEVKVRRQAARLRLARWSRRYAAIAVAVAVVLTVVFWAGRLAVPPVLATVAIDINPSVELDVAAGANHPVTAARAVNADGEHVLQAMDGGAASLNGRPLAAAAAAVTAAAGRAGFVVPDRGAVIVTVIPRGDDAVVTSLQAAATAGARRGLVMSGVSAPVLGFAVTPDEAAAARRAGRPVGVAAVVRAAAARGVKLDAGAVVEQGLLPALHEVGLGIADLTASGDSPAAGSGPEYLTPPQQVQHERKGQAPAAPEPKVPSVPTEPDKPAPVPEKVTHSDASPEPEPKMKPQPEVRPQPEPNPKPERPNVLEPQPPAVPELPSTLLPLGKMLPTEPGDSGSVLPKILAPLGLGNIIPAEPADSDPVLPKILAPLGLGNIIPTEPADSGSVLQKILSPLGLGGLISVPTPQKLLSLPQPEPEQQPLLPLQSLLEPERSEWSGILLPSGTSEDIWISVEGNLLRALELLSSLVPSRPQLLEILARFEALNNDWSALLRSYGVDPILWNKVWQAETP